MRQEFLSQVAEIYLEKHEDRLRDFLFVFPNRRSSVFFQRYLGEKAGHPVFSPDITTISSLFSSLSGYVVGDRLELLYILYGIYRSHVKSCLESFDEFLFWGDTILNDFDDIDKYLVDAQSLFTNIADLKEIDDRYSYLSEEQRSAISSFWGNLLPFMAGEKEKSFLEIWEQLYTIYSEFKTALEEKGIVYEGMMYRSVAEHFDVDLAEYASLMRYVKIVFVGFNALNKCEKAFLDKLNHADKAHFYWDYFGDIIKNPENKSSFFMHENVRKYSAGYPMTQDGGQAQEQKIRVIGLSSMVGQAKYLSEILRREVLEAEDPKSAAFNTAIVLPDEKLLLPVLNSIPEEISKINVTMGYSLSNSNCASFMNAYAQLYRRSSFKQGRLRFYFRNVQDLLNHPYILSVNPELAKTLKNEMIRQNMVYVDPDFLKGDELVEEIFGGAAEVISGIREEEASAANVKQIAQAQFRLLEKLHSQVDPLEGEFIYHYHLAITRIVNLNLPILPQTYFKLLKDAISMVQIPFKGEPLSGLQVMGNLEMRALDFKNLIILSVNDGIFPSHSVSNSMIPYNLRIGFDLPSYEYQDAISAYHFYRSIYRAENIYFLYDNRCSGTNTGEVSRFVKQLKYQHKVPMSEETLNFHIPFIQSQEEAVAKTPQMLEKMDTLNYSASSINTYLSCPKKFYYQYVEGIKEEEEVEEDVEANVFGTLYHKVMQDIYQPFQKTEVTAQMLDAVLKDNDKIRGYIRNAFRTEAHIDEISGKNKIVEALLNKFVRESLKNDRSQTPFTYLESEKKCYVSLDILSGKKKARLIGFIDRLDEKDGQLRIIDYKTGGSEIGYREMADLFDTENQKRPYTAFQLLYYMLLLKLSAQQKDGLNPQEEKSLFMVYSLKTLFKREFPSFMVSPEEYQEFTQLLEKTFEQMYDLSLPFRPTENANICSYCPFKIICKK